MLKWLRSSRNNQSSPSGSKPESGKCQTNKPSQVQSPIVIEISSDDSNTSLADKTMESDDEPMAIAVVNRNKVILSSTDSAEAMEESIESIEEETVESSRTTPILQKSKVFNWYHHSAVANRNNYSIYGESDSSDEFTSSPNWYTRNQKKKKVKTYERPLLKSKMNRTKKGLPLAEEPLPRTEEPLPRAEEPLPQTEEPLPRTEECLPRAEEPLPQVEKPLPRTEEPLPQAKECLPQAVIQYKQMIAGIMVKIPVKPYPCQVAVMHKVIQGCTKEENCLLESPTGSGKTLALLCGVLAWHDHYTDYNEAAELYETNAKTGHASTSRMSISDVEYYGGEMTTSTTIRKTPHVPKIYYGTRTHRQIEQVVRELRKTDYKQKKMAILSSREHTCIQETTKNKTDLCNDLLDPTKHKRCPFYTDSNRKTLSSFAAAESRGLGAVWDIEDLVAIGKKEEACPYFAARSLADVADIIFCPYNYIIDPYIRETIQLDVQNQIIILDEAHNIEDICRDVASVNFRYDSLQNAALECEALTKQRAFDFDTYNTLKAYILNLSLFLEETNIYPIDGKLEDQSSPYWSGTELLELLNLRGLSQAVYSDFVIAAKTAIADCNKAKEDGRAQKSVKPIISSSTKIVLEQLMFAMRMINSREHINDYRACVYQTMVHDFNLITGDTWYAANNSPRIRKARMLKLICMNPGVIFAPLAESARSIILASGTLSPTASFESELRTKFAHVLNAAHVIPKDQVFATCISRGPNNESLRATYSSTRQWAFQDELGEVLLDVCESVPHGVLCFFSSYNMMNMQLERWVNNKVWDKILGIKKVFIEPRFAKQLALVMTEYRQIIKDTSNEPQNGITGALLLAVFRGKIAEGIDFRDNEARCVVTVGIPYAVLKDPVIDMKVKYNDRNVSKNLLTGTDWYNIQAFRALNQALGRCLRHANDWGAVLLVDERFLLQHNEKKLPKWIQTMWVKRDVYNLKEDLFNFINKQKLRERANKIGEAQEDT
ncbi:Fanconi anemia group J protein homolog [Xylocopa sonorina]|uniref:Fanconi anemia group J protein homolog n=1 Tax=Xylocopa sonorina TaxID=1818115 RepID=UPI00403B14FA